MGSGKRLLTVAVLSVAAAALGACDENEQDRVLYHKKGVYQGQQDQPLNEETVDELRSRATRQAG